jgi:hypothetical protein
MGNPLEHGEFQNIILQTQELDQHGPQALFGCHRDNAFGAFAEFCAD